MLYLYYGKENCKPQSSNSPNHKPRNEAVLNR